MQWSQNLTEIVGTALFLMGENRQESGVRNIYQLALGCKSRILRSQDGSLSILYREVLTTEERGYETGYGTAGSNVL